MDFDTLSLIGQYLLDNDKKEWADTLKEFILLYQEMYSSDDSDCDYSDSEGSAVEETTYTTEDEQGFLSLI